MPDYTVTELNISYRQLTQLPDDIHLYTKLETLICIGNFLTQLDNLPLGLEKLYCGGNQITQLDNLPLSLEMLNCSGNNITQLDNLPQGLEQLGCNRNPLIYDFEPTLQNIKKYIASNVNIPTS